MNWLKHQRIDWRESTSELARKFDVPREEMRSAKEKFFRMLRMRSTSRAAKLYGVSQSHVKRMRVKYGVSKRPKRIKPKPTRPPRPPGRTHSEGLRSYVLQAIDNGAKQFKDIRNFVLLSWGAVSDRSVYGALSHLCWEKQIMYTVVNNVRMYTRVQ